MAEEIERIYTIPLRTAKFGVSSRRADRAVLAVRKFISRHMKVEGEKVWMAGTLNEQLWGQGKYKCPSKIRVRAIKFEDGQVEVSLPEDEVRTHRDEIKKQRESKTPILKRELAEEEGEEAEGAEEEAEGEVEPEAEGEPEAEPEAKADAETKEE